MISLKKGTIWYTMFKFEPVIEFANMLNYTAMSLGNHEFDDALEGLVPLSQGANFDLLAANLVDTEGPKLNYAKSKVVDVNGRKNMSFLWCCHRLLFEGRPVGVIGYITADTASISSPDASLRFLPVIDTVSKEAKALRRQGKHEDPLRPIHGRGRCWIGGQETEMTCCTFLADGRFWPHESHFSFLIFPFHWLSWDGIFT